MESVDPFDCNVSEAVRTKHPDLVTNFNNTPQKTRNPQPALDAAGLAKALLNLIIWYPELHKGGDHI